MEHLTQKEIMRLVYKINGELKLTSEEEERLSHTVECEICEKQIAQCLELLKLMKPDYVQNLVQNSEGNRTEEENEELDEWEEELAEYKMDFEEE